MKKIEGKYKFAFILLILYIILMAIIFGPIILRGKTKMYLLIGSTAKWKFENNEWEDIESNETDLYAFKNFDVYIDQKKFGNYQVAFSQSKWYLFQNNKTPVNYRGDFLGVRSNSDYQVAQFERVDLDESDNVYLEKVFKNHGFDKIERYQEGYKVLFDLDGDKKDETIYVVSNMFPSSFAPATIFNFVFVVDNEKIEMVYEMTDAFTNLYNQCKIRLQYLIDVDNNNHYEIILNCGYYSTMGSCTSMYEKQGKKYVQIKACHAN